MKLPRDLSGDELASLLRRYGYSITRQTGGHMRLTSTIKGREHHISIPAHKALKVGTISSVVTEVAGYLETPREQFIRELFG